jgi:hypothetical protein
MYILQSNLREPSSANSKIKGKKTSASSLLILPSKKCFTYTVLSAYNVNIFDTMCGLIAVLMPVVLNKLPSNNQHKRWTNSC